jgi:hypothetical protein
MTQKEIDIQAIRPIVAFAVPAITGTMWSASSFWMGLHVVQKPTKLSNHIMRIIQTML